jgi:hypothetical protein
VEEKHQIIVLAYAKTSHDRLSGLRLSCSPIAFRGFWQQCLSREIADFAILLFGVIRAMGQSKPMVTTGINSAAVQCNTGRSGYAEKGGCFFFPRHRWKGAPEDIPETIQALTT